MFNE
jgi:hypothetical protein